MPEGFTAKANSALEHADMVSKEMRSAYVGTEHILVGIMREGTGVGAAILKESRIYESRIMDLMREIISPAGGSTTLLKERHEYSAKALEVLRRCGG